MRYAIKVSSAKMSGTAKNYPYVRVGLMEMEDDFLAPPSMISSRARGVKRVVATWEGCRVGKTERAANHRAIKEAKELMSSLLASNSL